MARARQLLAAAGAALALAAIWLDPTDEGGGSYWSDHSTGIFLLVLGLGVVVLLAGGIVLRRDRLVDAAILVGMTAWGFYLFLPALNAFAELGRLAAGGWLGAASGLLLVVAGGAGLPRLARRGEGREPPPLTLARLLAGAGFVVVAASLWFRVWGSDRVSASYWSFGGHHSLGIFMLLVAGAGLLLVGAGALVRGLFFEALTVAVALVLLGLTLWYPVVLSPDNLGTLRSVAWLALGGAALASAGAAVTLALESRQAPPLEPGTFVARQ